ncbi:MAG: prenyltransferase, partial [Nitrosopumilaceae archaeon]
KRAASSIWIFPSIAYAVIITGVGAQILPVFSLITLFTIPLLIKSGHGLKQNFDNTEKLVPVMSSCVLYSRITGVLLVLSFLFSITQYN